MNIKRMIAAAGSVAALWAVNAHADINLGAIGPAGISQSFALGQSGAYSEVFDFSLTSGSGAQLGVSSFFQGVTIQDIPGVTFSLNGAAPVAAQASADFANSGISYGYTFAGLTPATNYSLQISIAEVSNLGDHYALQVAAVPEPDSYAMLLGGLGLIGFMARRRRIG